MDSIRSSAKAGPPAGRRPKAVMRMTDDPDKKAPDSRRRTRWKPEGAPVVMGGKSWPGR